MKCLWLLTIPFFIISCTKEYSVENPPVQIQPQLPTSPVTDITGIWVGKIKTLAGTMNYCWKITKDSFFTYDGATMPQIFPDLRGKWKLNGNVFKAQSNYNDFDVFSDSAILSNDLKNMTGIEIFETGNRSYGSFTMNKK